MPSQREGSIRSGSVRKGGLTSRQETPTAPVFNASFVDLHHCSSTFVPSCPTHPPSPALPCPALPAVLAMEAQSEAMGQLTSDDLSSKASQGVS